MTPPQAAAPSLTDQIRAILRQRPAVLVVDLTGVHFLATAGMSVLMEADRKCKELDISFRVVAQGPVTVRSMQLLGIDDCVFVEARQAVPTHQLKRLVERQRGKPGAPGSERVQMDVAVERKSQPEHMRLALKTEHPADPLAFDQSHANQFAHGFCERF